MKANTLVMAASTEGWVEELDEVQYMPSIDLPEVQQIEGEENWMTPIIAYLRDGSLPEERDEARRGAIQKRHLSTLPKVFNSRRSKLRFEKSS